MKAGPRKGISARRPRRSPLSDRSAARRTRRSPALAQRAVAHRPDLAGEGRDDVSMRIEPRTAEQIEDALLHTLGDHVLEAFRLVVDLVPAVAQDLDQEHLQQPVVADQLEGDLA